MDKILLATTNTGKIKELKDIFKQTGVKMLSLNDLNTKYEPPVEDGKDLICPNCGAKSEKLVLCVPVDTRYAIDKDGVIIYKAGPTSLEEEIENIRDDIEDSVEISCKECQSVFMAEFDENFRVVIKDSL